MSTGDAEAITEDLAGGSVTVKLAPAGGGEVNLAVKYGDAVVESGTYPVSVFSKPTPKGAFLNSVEESLEKRSGVDAADVRGELKEWLGEFNEMGKEEQQKHVLPAEVNAIIEGTQYPVEIYDGEPTVWKVTLQFAGRLRELEFTAAEIVNGSGGALEEKLANQFFEVVEIAEDDWLAIRDRWLDNTKVQHLADETTADAIADRVLAKIRERAIPVGEREKFGNAPEAVWFDEGNSTPSTQADPDADIAWIQGDFLVDQLERAGKKIEYKGQLVKDLIARGDLHGGSERRRWIDGRRVRVYPFDPEALGMTVDDVAGDDDPAHSEVDA